MINIGDSQKKKKDALMKGEKNTVNSFFIVN